MSRKTKPKARPRVSVSYAEAKMYFSYPNRCFLCGADIPANTWHTCSSVKPEAKK